MNWRIICAILCINPFFYGQIVPLRTATDKARIKLAQIRTSPEILTRWVNPFIGTGGHGHTFPGATLPFGMVQLSPDTRMEGWDGCGGYHYSDSIIFGFSHTHLSGTGVPDYADLLITPVCGAFPKVPKYRDAQGYGATFSHAQEKAEPGYYQVELLNEGITAELTATARAGIHRYTFHSEGTKYIVLDLDYRDAVIKAGFTQINSTEIRGFRESNSWAKHQYFYFSLTSSVPYEKADEITINGQHRLVLSYPSSTKSIELRVGISAVDELGAAQNVELETQGLRFEEIRENAHQIWEKELGKIKIEDENITNKINFYTALYHAFLAPNLFSDNDGRYRGRDLAIHTMDQGIPQYTVFSLWDTYRATHPLFTLIDQKRTLGYITTFLRQHKEGGDLPVWELAGNETECMIGFHSVSVIADAYRKGINGFDAESALAACVETSNRNEFSKPLLTKFGMLSSDWESESVSKALEYAYDHFCISAFANDVFQSANVRNQNNDLAKRHRLYSLSFINHFDPTTKFMRARRGAQWLAPFDPTEVNFNFTEANSWQYSLYAPHEPEILTELIGGRQALSDWLDQLFTNNNRLSGREQADITGLIGQYAHGNEPSHHMAYMYNYSATPWKTQKYVDSIQHTLYRNAPDGLSGNEDCGQMSAWYVLSALGFYPLAPGIPEYTLGHPLFRKATVQLENGKSLGILKTGEGIYIEKVLLNGVVQEKIQHQDLMAGGTLEFKMAKLPPLQAGERQKYEIAIPKEFVPVPFIANSTSIFEDSLTLTLGIVDLGDAPVAVEYALNDAQGPLKWNAYTKPFILYNSCKVYVRGKKQVGKEVYYSAEVDAAFTKKDNNIQLTLATEYAPAYAASGPNTLIDKIRGGVDFRTGAWQGFQGKDVMAEIRFTKAVNVKKLGVSYLRDLNSWIFDPKSLRFEVSFDGKEFKEAFVHNFDALKIESDEKKITNFEKGVNYSSVKCVRVTVKNSGACPDWHKGKGNPSWLFLDEILIE
jgi:predicted alpha-1,2-mannosidase